MRDYLQDDETNELQSEDEELRPEKKSDFFRIIAILFVLGIYAIIFLKIVFLA